MSRLSDMLDPVPTVWKYVAGLLFFGIIIVGALALGYSHGYSSGYLKATSDKQNEINKLTSQFNKQQQQANDKITALEQSAADYEAQVEQWKSKVDKQQSKIIIEYRTKYQKVAATCGWSAPTVNAINSVLAVGTNQKITKGQPAVPQNLSLPRPPSLPQPNSASSAKSTVSLGIPPVVTVSPKPASSSKYTTRTQSSPTSK